jgi:hypothetical protein
MDYMIRYASGKLKCFSVGSVVCSAGLSDANIHDIPTLWKALAYHQIYFATEHLPLRLFVFAMEIQCGQGCMHGCFWFLHF